MNESRSNSIIIRCSGSIKLASLIYCRQVNPLEGFRVLILFQQPDHYDFLNFTRYSIPKNTFHSQ